MASQHRWTYPLACPTCQTSGQATVAEAAGPPFGDLPTRTYTVAGGFRITSARTGSAEAQFECNVCGAAAS